MTIRRDIAEQVLECAAQLPVVTVTGPRQSGKTTLCRQLFAGHPYVSLEDPAIRQFAFNDPKRFLGGYPNGAILDEVQRAPELLSYLQGLVDADATPGRWILTGSQNLSLLSQVSQSLAGRTGIFHLLPLSRREALRFPKAPATLEEALFMGGYPRIFDRQLQPSAWLGMYAASYLERDVRQILNIGNMATFQRFIQLAAGRTGQALNISELAGDCGVAPATVGNWLSVLEASYITFRLPPYFRNISKRLAKTPKLYFYDTGLACWLLGIQTPGQLRLHPLRGALFETWVVSELAKLRTRRDPALARGMYFYREKNVGEVDLLLERPQGVLLVEAKSGATPDPSMLAQPRRARRHFDATDIACDIAVAYGGDQAHHTGAGPIVPWHALGGLEDGA
ncbi:MAG: ATP-binding protein [Gammaproteobacteria bacterium]|nr:ATP-binding protein [Gammaproteobacteria bacterium]